MWPIRLCHRSIIDLTFCYFANKAAPMSLVSRINIHPSWHPCEMIWPYSSMKHPRCVNRTCIPWSMTCPTDTRFFVIVGTCNKFKSFPLCLTRLRGTSLTCSIRRILVLPLLNTSTNSWESNHCGVEDAVPIIQTTDNSYFYLSCRDL